MYVSPKDNHSTKPEAIILGYVLLIIESKGKPKMICTSLLMSNSSTLKDFVCITSLVQSCIFVKIPLILSKQFKNSAVFCKIGAYFAQILAMRCTPIAPT